MTTTAHNARRVWGGASLARNAESGNASRVSMYQLLHPEMYSRAKPKVVKRTPMGQRVYDWLMANGKSTGRQIAEGIGANVDSIHNRLSHGVLGVVHVETIKAGDGRKIKVWGIENEITTG